MPGTGGQETDPGKVAIGYEFKLTGNETKVKIIPHVYLKDKPKYFEEGVFKLDIK